MCFHTLHPRDVFFTGTPTGVDRSGPATASSPQAPQLASQHLVPSHLVSIRVFDVEPDYHVGSRLDFEYIDPVLQQPLEA